MDEMPLIHCKNKKEKTHLKTSIPLLKTTFSTVVKMKRCAIYSRLFRNAIFVVKCILSTGRNGDGCQKIAHANKARKITYRVHGLRGSQGRSLWDDILGLGGRNFERASVNGRVYTVKSNLFLYTNDQLVNFDKKSWNFAFLSFLNSKMRF